MPYTVKGKCVYKKDGGAKVGCTKGSVKKYLAALHANADESVELEQTITEIYTNKPDIFTHTIYRSPTKEELEEVNEYNLNANEILNGFGYTLIGRGILSSEIKTKIVEAISRLSSMYPENEEYKIALKEAHKMKPRGLRGNKLVDINESTKQLIKRLIREKIGL